MIMNISSSRFVRMAIHPLSLIALAWFAAVLSRLTKNGDVYGLNYDLFQPDGSLYHAYTLYLQGNSWSDSARLVNEFFQSQIGISYLGQTITPVVQNVIFSRPLFSILSFPFVLLLGQYGMLAIPALSYLVVGISLYLVGKKVGRPYLAALLFFTLTLSTSVNRWMVSDLTDGLLVALISVIYILILYSRLKTPLIALISLALLTRPSGPLLVALLLPFAFAYRRVSIYLGIAISVFGTLTLAFVSPEAAGTQTSGDYTVYQRIQDFALHAVKVFVVEFGQLFVMDRVLFVFIILSITTALLTWRNVYSQSFLALFVACFAMGAWNGALGVNFRYQLPLVFAGSVVLIFSIGDLVARINKLKETRSQN